MYTNTVHKSGTGCPGNELLGLDVSKVRIEQDPYRAGQPSIGCEVVAKPQSVGSDVVAGVDVSEDGLRALTEGAECSALSNRALHSILRKCGKAISRGEADLGRTSLVKHLIETGGAQPVMLPPRRLPQAQREVVDRLIREMLHAGVIEPASGPWSSPVVMVRKKDGSSRFCVDYRRLNSVTRVDAQPIPRIDDTLDALAGAKWFSTLDLASGYWQVEVAERDREKTALSTPLGLFQFRVMPFVLCNAPATFHRLMQKALRGPTWKTCLFYLDDIIVFGKTEEEHLERLEGVLSRLQSVGLKIKPEKCQLMRQSVRYLGHIVTQHGVGTDPEKTAAFQEWPTSRLQPHFPNGCGCQRRRHQGSVVTSRRAGPTGGGRVCQPLALTGGAELLRDAEGDAGPSLCYSPLPAILEPEGQVACWLEKLAEFDFEVVHRPGKKHQNADAFSRRATVRRRHCTPTRAGTSTKASIDHPEDWDVYLDRVLLAYRTSALCTTGATPSRVLFGRELRLPVDLMYGVPTDAQLRSAGQYVQHLRRDLERVYEVVGKKAGREQRRQKAWKDRKAYGPVYEPSDQWFSTLDLASGYWQVEVAEEDREKTAFSTPLGLFQFRVMPFGLCNAPATFQRLMEKALRGLTWKTCLVYLDDVIVFGNTEEKHLERLEGVLSRLQSVELKIKPEKCQLMRQCTLPGPRRNAARDWYRPREDSSRPKVAHAPMLEGGPATVRQLFWRRGEFSARTDQERRKVALAAEGGGAFTRLKEALVSPPILGHPDFDRTFLLDVDEREDAVRAVLSQQGGQDPPAVIAYASRPLSRAERGYCATRREMLALVWATQHFRVYLYYGCGTFENRQDLEQLYEAVWGRKSSEQQRQKFWKDRKAHGPVYEPGDQVGMQVPEWNKQGAYWDGPYEVQKKLDWNTYRVKEMKGRRRRLVVHFDRLNPYHAPSEREGAWGKQRDRRKTRRPAWLQDFIQTQEVSTGRALHEGESSAADMDRVNEISPADNKVEEN
ncbi:Retrovirus-related Pol polyprotein from transposon 17.6 [Trichinella britovi]|uniref:Retrovirus-related Pol polyprotein from transposon 17.6 n=1 Tax=Trichinella britovi TaxID=45882 RepID=A0A0V1D0G9_TRIBR|nr:Retrovirus-related Pol polyprotein from transposon 17.6 [Trichinella britovi]